MDDGVAGERTPHFDGHVAQAAIDGAENAVDGPEQQKTYVLMCGETNSWLIWVLLWRNIVGRGERTSPFVRVGDVRTFEDIRRQDLIRQLTIIVDLFFFFWGVWRIYLNLYL